MNGDPADPDLIDGFAYEVRARFARRTREKVRTPS